MKLDVNGSANISGRVYFQSYGTPLVEGVSVAQGGRLNISTCKNSNTRGFSRIFAAYNFGDYAKYQELALARHQSSGNYMQITSLYNVTRGTDLGGIFLSNGPSACSIEFVNGYGAAVVLDVYEFVVK